MGIPSFARDPTWSIMAVMARTLDQTPRTNGVTARMRRYDVPGDVVTRWTEIPEVL